MAITLSDFRLDEITDANLRADFKADGVRYQSGIRMGHRHDVATGIVQADVQLRMRDEDFDNDTFLSVSKIRDISELVGDEFEKRYLSLIGGAS